jgi:hypothetical protein
MYVLDTPSLNVSDSSDRYRFSVAFFSGWASPFTVRVRPESQRAKSWDLSDEAGCPPNRFRILPIRMKSSSQLSLWAFEYSKASAANSSKLAELGALNFGSFLPSEMSARRR